jgi:two-component system, NarL family, sensor histidine kinase DesK
MAIGVGGSGQAGQAGQAGQTGQAAQAGQASEPARPPGPYELAMSATGESATPRTTGEAASRGTREAGPRTGLFGGALGLQRIAVPSVAWRWFFSGIWLLYLIGPVAALFSQGHGALWIAGGLTITAAFCAIYMPVLLCATRRPHRALLGLIALAVLAVLACAVYGAAWTPLWVYVSAAAGMVLTAPPFGRRTAVRGVLAVCACYVFFSWLTHAGIAEFLAVLLPVLLVGVAMIGFRLQLQLMHELEQARETVAKLAANSERLRLARDMHDLTGQSLSMITLKSDLAAKRLSRLPASADRDAALGDLGDIGRVSRQTLHDIREAVSGYRRPTLAIEVITARNALEAAGIRLDDDPGLTLRSGTFDADAEAVLAWCLREAVTNVIRHSGASSCRIRLTEGAGELSLEVADDGRGAGHQGPEAPDGAGLHGMSERLSGVGGRLSLGPADPGPGLRYGHGFRLIATVPAGRRDP